MATGTGASVPATPRLSSGGRYALPVRSTAAWTRRGALALAITALGYFVITFSLAQASRRDPARAYALASYDGRNAARLAAALNDADATAAERARSAALGRAALRRDAVSPAAASAIGITAQTRGDIVGARRAFAYAVRLSRRDLPAQLWAIEDAVSRGDVRDAIGHYDVALRVKPALWELLFPVLAAASTQAPVGRELVRKLATQPIWTGDFINYAAANSADPRAMVVLFRGLRRAHVPVPDTAQAGLINALTSRGMFDQAWGYYRTIRPGAERERLRDPSFAARTEAPTAFDWMSRDDNGIVTAVEDGAFRFDAPASVGGPMLQQMQLLPPGSYRLSGRSAELDQPADSTPYWTLTCQSGRELGRIDVPASAKASGAFGGTFRVPADCPQQMLTLVAQPSDAVDGLSGRILRVELQPVG